jgi:hypothetical protein
VIVVYEAIQYSQPLVPQVRCTVPWLDKRTKGETQNYHRDEPESVRVEEQYLVQVTISTRSDTYISFLLMFVQHQSLSHLLSFG